MKLIAVLMFVSILQVSANSYAQNVNLNVKNASLKEVFRLLTDQTEYEFIYNSSMLQNTNKISIVAKNEPFLNVLKKCFLDQPVSFLIKNNTIVITKPEQGLAVNDKVVQNTISGTVISSDDGKPLPGVSVKVKGVNKNAITDINGNFKIEADINQTLVFSYVGFENQEVLIKSLDPIKVSLKVSVKSLSDVVVIGYGTRKKEDLSGAVTQVTAKEITKQPVTSFDQALQGLVPGVTIREGTGAPGAGPEILVRGINTFGNNKPLIVIDDVIYEGYNDQNNNPLALLNPEDIESISVLKDAASKSIYGSRATAGVILVTTKKGMIGKPKINYSFSGGFSNYMKFEKPKVLNATELAQFRREATIDRIRFTNPAYADPNTTVPESLIPTEFQNPSQYGVGTDWFDEVTRTAYQQNQNLSVNGGTENVKYYVSGNYLNQDGIVIGNDIKRYSFRSNVDFKISPKWNFGLNVAPSRTLANRPADDPSAGQFSAYSTITSTYWISPEAKVKDANGNFVYTTQSPLLVSWTANPVYQIEAETEKRLNNQLAFGSYLEFKPIKNLSFKTKISYSNNLSRTEAFSPSTVAGDGLNPTVPRLIGATAAQFSQDFSNIISDNLVTYSFNKNKHQLDLLGGLTYQDTKLTVTSINAQRLLDENLTQPSFSNVDKSTVGNFSGGESFGENNIISYISRANYIYNNRYYVNATARYDISSKFGRNVQGGFFPAASVAWRATEEEFVKNLNIKWLNDLRFEVGYGITGSTQGNGIGNYSYLGSVGQSNYIFGGVSTLGNTLTGLPNPDLTWEESKQLDLGINADLLKGRVSLAFNMYKQNTSGLLASVPLPLITGFGGVGGNLGEVQNKGFEADIQAIPVKTKNFSWTTGLNFSRYKNKIISLPNGTFYSANAGNGTQIAKSEVGQPVGMYIGLKVLGLFTAADIADPNVPKYPGAAVGTIKYLDGNGNGKLEVAADYVTLANPHPDLMFGWNNQFNYKKFNLRTIFAGQLGGAIYDLRKEIMYNLDGNFNVSRDVLERYRPGDDPSTKKYATSATATNYFRFPNSQKVFDGTYIALKNLTFGYDITTLTNFKKKILDKAEVFVSARNVFYIAAYKEGNPEIRRSNDGSAVRSVNYGSYPISTTFLFGLNVSF
ncbi:TonB-dependent receptor [Pedobacter sp. SD-b]|uniref:TonB-dependent receptor n=1 Tax=Pedobacter segetis TaxID=2793069 RepID=A0ABS1BGV2_9SPHI|nr:TonB-dependent receptor [Pedobacter segetis]MBK0382094.1 TonB-dependent receptor [Pedobacter segetis]